MTEDELGLIARTTHMEENFCALIAPYFSLLQWKKRYIQYHNTCRNFQLHAGYWHNLRNNARKHGNV